MRLPWFKQRPADPVVSEIILGRVQEFRRDFGYMPDTLLIGYRALDLLREQSSGYFVPIGPLDWMGTGLREYAGLRIIECADQPWLVQVAISGGAVKVMD